MWLSFVDYCVHLYVEKKLTAMLKKIVTALSRLCVKFVGPVLDSIGFFVVLVLLSVAEPVAYMFVERNSVLHFMFYDFAKGTAAAYLLCVLVSLVKPKMWRTVLKLFVAVPMALFSIVEVGAIVMTGSALTPETMMLILGTNAKETEGFFVQYFSAKVIVAIALLILVLLMSGYVAICLVRRLTPYRRIVALVCAPLLACLMVFGALKWAEVAEMLSVREHGQLTIWLGQGPVNVDMLRANELLQADPLSKMLYLSKVTSLQNRDFDRWEETQKRALLTSVESGEDLDFDIVMVVGESFVRSHSSVYGYYLPTSPRLEAEADSGRLVAFSDMLVPANFTFSSLRNIFNLNDLSSGEPWADGVYFPLLMKKAGWNVYHYDNQTVSSHYDAAVSQMFYSPLVMRSVYDGVSDRLFEYDGDYVAYVDSILRPRECSGRQLSIYHLMGQHVPASHRFKGKGRFSASDITADVPWLDDARRAEVADYDNATWYNDSVVSAIIDGRRARPTVLFYFSDHGEDIWDLAPVEARNVQQPDNPAWLDRQYRVPFFVWFSDSFIARYPELVSRIRGAAERPGMLDNFGQALLGLIGAESPYYKPERDILRDSYLCGVRVTADGHRF